jgi:hypothetical protein
MEIGGLVNENSQGEVNDPESLQTRFRRYILMFNAVDLSISINPVRVGI